MAQNVVLYNLLISCPGDVQGEVKLIEDAVGEFNELYILTQEGTNANNVGKEDLI